MCRVRTGGKGNILLCSVSILRNINDTIQIHAVFRPSVNRRHDFHCGSCHLSQTVQMGLRLGVQHFRIGIVHQSAVPVHVYASFGDGCLLDSCRIVRIRKTGAVCGRRNIGRYIVRIAAVDGDS